VKGHYLNISITKTQDLSDHLGSSSWITDASGAVNQHLQYLPLRQAQGSAFGEDFIYQRNSSWAVPYTFSGKEKDSETGYSYFGARYYDSDLSIWLSVDPLADKYPSMSAYMYVAGNPVMLVDPDGRDWFQNELTGDVYYNSDMRKGQEGTGAMTGEGWQHLGKNGMFMKDENDFQNSDHFVLFRNGAGLAEGETGPKYNNNTDGTSSLEASFKGDNAKKFMAINGYSYVPKEYEYLNNTIETTLPEGNGPMTTSMDNGSKITDIYSWQYVKSDLFKHSQTVSYGRDEGSRLAFNQINVIRTDRMKDNYSSWPAMNGLAKDMTRLALDMGAKHIGESIGNRILKSIKRR
jgi:RHS repeat-associated protein